MKRTIRMFRPRFIAVMLLIFALSGSSILAVQSGPPGQGPFPGVADQKLSKVSQDLHALRQEYQTYLNQGGGAALEPSNPLLPIIDDRVVVDAVASRNTSALLADLEALGLQRAAAYGRMVSGQLPIGAIGDLDALDSLNFVRPAYAMTSVGLVDSQGDRAMNSDDARGTWSVDGTGITVGTLSDSYDCASAPITDAAADVANGDLPAGIVVLDDTGCAVSNSDEGRAMMQIIADVAPGADQAFHTAFGGTADYASGIVELATVAGADVIVDDVGVFSAPFFQDGIIAQAVDEVFGMGVAYFSAAGNMARESYERPFRPSGIGPTADYDAHDFDPGAGVVLTQSVTIPVGAKVLISLQWDQPFYDADSGSPGSANDLDIFLFDDPVTTLLLSSTNRNVGVDPLEILSFVNPGPLTAFNIVIAKYLPAGGPDPGLLKYVGAGITINAWETDSSTIFGHANAAGAVAVGAAAYYDTPEFGTDPAVLEPFSSGGGTPTLFATDGTRLTTPKYRPKPLIVAPDNGNNTFFGRDIPDPGDGSDTDTHPNFPGTSAAAPHAAGVAALLRDANGCLAPTDLYTLLADTALDMDGPNPGFPDGFDDDSGYGLIEANAALALLADSAYGCLVYLPFVLSNHDPSQLVQNGNFDTGTWTPWQTIGSPELSDQVYRSASYSARLAGRNDVDSDYVVQEVTVPANATEVTLDLWYRVSSNDPSSPEDFMCVEILDSAFTTVLVSVFCSNLYDVEPKEQWINYQRAFTGAELTPLLGQTVALSFQGWTNTTNPSTVWVDDVSFKVTGAGR